MTAKDIITLAAEELGYIGKKSNKDLDDKTANITGKFTKYARDLYAAGYYNGNKNGYDWCCVFVDWLFWRLAGSKEAALKVKPTDLYGAGVYWAYKYLNDKGMTSNTPEVGAQIFYATSGGVLSHTGIVEAINGDTLTTIEGNWSNAVSRRTIKATDSRIYGYGLPAYEAEPIPDDSIVISAEEYANLLNGLTAAEQAATEAANALRTLYKEVSDYAKH